MLLMLRRMMMTIMVVVMMLTSMLMMISTIRTMMEMLTLKVMIRMMTIIMAIIIMITTMIMVIMMTMVVRCLRACDVRVLDIAGANPQVCRTRLRKNVYSIGLCPFLNLVQTRASKPRKPILGARFLQKDSLRSRISSEKS